MRNIKNLLFGVAFITGLSSCASIKSIEQYMILKKVDRFLEDYQERTNSLNYDDGLSNNNYETDSTLTKTHKEDSYLFPID